MKNKSILSQTLKDNLCIGCGICVAACPTNVIKMQYGQEKYKKPVVDEEGCINCGKCVKYCPNTFEKIIEESKKVVQCEDYRDFGIKGAKYYIAYAKNKEERIKSASGGVATAIGKWLLDNKKIDVVVHARMVYGKIGEPHYEACISNSKEQLDENRSSFYGAISFDKILLELKEKQYSKVLFLGTPCVIRGVKNLIHNEKEYSFISNIYTVALSCSHNVSGMFVDYLSSSQGVDDKTEFKLNLRAKEKNAKDASNFVNNWISKENTVFITENRYITEFTNQWRNYSFSMNVCNACSDFWGYEADLSIKDAWGKWDKEPLGTSMVIVRNLEFEEFFKNSNCVEGYEETFDIIQNTQSGTIKYKQYYASERISIKNAKELNNVSFTHRLNHHMRNISIKKYQKMLKCGYSDDLKKYAVTITKIRRICEGLDNKIIKLRRRISK